MNEGDTLDVYKGQYDGVIRFPKKCIVNENVTLDVYKNYMMES